MKLRTTTPASIPKIAKIALFVMILVAVVGIPIQMSQKVSADEYDDRINALQQDIVKYQAEGVRLNSESATLQSALAQITNQKSSIQTQIDLSQAKYDQLVVQIADTEQKILENQNALGKTIADIYVDDKISPIEMLASSKNIGDFMDKQEYRESVSDELKVTISTIQDLKKQLDSDKVEVEKILADQKSQRDSLVAKENEHQTLIQKTQGEEAGYQQLISNSQAAIAEAKATQILVNSRFNSNGGFTIINAGSLGDYPWNYSNCPMVSYFSTGGSNGNGGDGYGYGCRQCVSYVAWKIAKETGKYYSWGSAVNFTANAVGEGYVEGPAQAGSIAVMDPGKAGQSYGHVAWVESASGGMVTISQYNYDYGDGYGMYSVMTLSEGAFDHYVKIK